MKARSEMSGIQVMLELSRKEVGDLREKVDELQNTIEFLRIYAMQTHEYLVHSEAIDVAMIRHRLAAMAGHLPGYNERLDEIFEK